MQGAGIVLMIAGLAIILAGKPADPPAQGSTPLCEIDRLPRETQRAWDFWMGPYEFVPCKWVHREGRA